MQTHIAKRTLKTGSETMGDSHPLEWENEEEAIKYLASILVDGFFEIKQKEFADANTVILTLDKNALSKS